MNFLFYFIFKCRNLIKKITRKYKRKYYTYIVKKVAKAVGSGLRVNGYSVVNKNTSLGTNVNFNGLSILGKGEVVIGNNFHSGTGCIIMNTYHNYDNGSAIPYDNTTVDKKVIIEDNVWLGTNVTVLGGITIGEGAIIQIGSVVVCDIPPLAIAGGHPAKVYKYRDKEHYYKLKEMKKFF